jgi:N-acetylneuraminate synthase
VIIAEAGVNHNGSLARALDLVDVAADAGADIVKFQTFRATALTTADASKAQYQVTNTGHDGSQLEMLRALELSVEDHHTLVARCRERSIRFMSTAFDSASLDFVTGLDIAAIKIPSGDLTAGPLLLRAARTRRSLILSTGMGTLAEVESALAVIAFGLLHDEEPRSLAQIHEHAMRPEAHEALSRHVSLLHCVTEYPASADMTNLRAMETMRHAFRLPVGYSDHTLGTEIAIAAVALGATIIEKHFTLDRTLPGPDHAASLEPDELRAMVRAVRNVEKSLGSGVKSPVAAELANRPVARRSIVAARPIRRGEVFALDMLSVKRPGTGLSPMEIWDVVGRIATRDFVTDESIRL